MIKRDSIKLKFIFPTSHSKIHNLKSVIYSKGFTRLNFTPKNFNGFTIVELLVVIVVIGILAAITIVSYTGLSGKANVASLQSDLSSAKKQLALYQVEHSAFPTSLTADGNKYCPTGGTEYCFKTSTGNTFTYTSISPYSTFSLTNINTNSNTIYTVTNDSGPTVIPTVTIGTQTWMQNNLDVGTMITAPATQSNNSILEKWCNNNNPTNCTTYGGLYQWDEMMQYSTTPGVQGIAPAGFHIPTDAEYTTLSAYLGGTSVAGDKLKSAGLCQGRTPCGTSGFNGQLGGYNYGGSWDIPGSYGLLWSSSQSDASSAYFPTLYIMYTHVYRTNYPKTDGFSVRALKN